ncbi:hypothetical protein OIU77_016353 [Salix suchowensis]|uniref:Uncharacterized protein n=1 Tax=Salix suchowensis TaxID=1278906 RepID=A0ABQ8ZKA4_9ROSI|nr:hypothetical protein OIU77_016353 [Salix suchowensis]
MSNDCRIPFFCGGDKSIRNTLGEGHFYFLLIIIVCFHFILVHEFLLSFTPYFLYFPNLLCLLWSVLHQHVPDIV